MISLFHTPSDAAQAASTKLATPPIQLPASEKTKAVKQSPLQNVAALNASAPKADPSLPVPQRRGFKWFGMGRAKKRLQMLETVPLGEKRFVALVQVDGRQFLIGGAPSNVGMLAELSAEESFHQVLKDATQGAGSALPKAAPEAAKSVINTPELPPSTQPTATDYPATGSRPAIAVQSAPAQPQDESLDTADEESFSMSPTLLAAMQNTPAAQVQIETPVQPELVAEPEAPTQPEVRKAAIVRRSSLLQKAQTAHAVLPLAPSFTFHVPHLVPDNSTALSKQPAHTGLPKLSRRRIATQKPYGATA